MKIKMLAPDNLTPYDGNPRVIPDEAIDAVAKSIESAGFRQPIVVDSEGVIVIGHTRRLAAMKLGLKRVPVHEVTDLEPEKIQALRLNDNRSAEFTDWDQLALGIEVSDLATSDFDLESLVFDDAEMARLLDTAEEFEPSLDPKAVKGHEVTDEDMEKAKAKMTDDFDQRSNQDLVDVICPHCAEEFSIHKSELKG